jgi:endonuclease G
MGKLGKFLSIFFVKVGEGFNRDKWSDLEKHVRGLLKKYENVWVCTGPLYLPK